MPFQGLFSIFLLTITALEVQTMTLYKEKVIDERELVSYPDPYNEDVLRYFRIGYQRFEFSVGEDTWKKGDVLSDRKLSYLRKKAGQQARRTLRRIKRAELYKSRHEAFVTYVRENKKAFNKYRLEHLDRKFKSDQEAERRYNKLTLDAIATLSSGKASVFDTKGKRIPGVKKPSRRAIIDQIGFTRRQLKLEMRKINAPWTWVDPPPFPKRKWDHDVVSLFSRSISKVPKKKRLLRKTANFCNSYETGFLEGWETPLFITRDDGTSYVMEYHQYFHPRMDYSGGDYFARFPSFKWEPNDEIKLINKLGVKWRKAELNAGNFLGESHKTYDMMALIITNLKVLLERLINHEFSKIYSSVSNYAKYLVKNPRAFTKESADKWLMYAFGIAPLISDITSLAEGLASYEVEDRDPYRVRVSHSKIIAVVDYPIISRFNTSDRDPNDSTPILVASFEMKITKRYIATLKRNVQDKPWTDFLNKWMLNDVMDVLWEVSPYSWFVDYFLHIQQTLQASQVIREMPMDRLMTSTKTSTFNYTTKFVNGSKLSWVAPPPKGYRDEHFERKELFFISCPKPEFVNISEAMSPTHLANTIAAVIGLTSKLKAFDRITGSKLGNKISVKFVKIMDEAVKKKLPKPPLHHS